METVPDTPPFACYGIDAFIIVFGALLSTLGLWTAVRSLKRRSNDTGISLLFQKYRMIQVLACYKNACFQKSIFLGLTFELIVLNIVSFAGLITFYGSLKPSILFLLTLLNITVIGVAASVYKIPGMVNLLSKDVIAGWKRNVDGRYRRSRLESRILKSCSEIKIRFGEMNYFEAATSLTIINFQVEKTVNFVLLNC
ncbi:unnamed protein product [Orchesella dallaii]|uniref:G protein-coupled receptor n=1 Tax=Orchesella dallaii TaxID=48710 RepID=A0ABP1R4K7_9HEXA